MKTNYFDTLAAGLDEIAAHCERERATSTIDIRQALSDRFGNGVMYGDTQCGNFELETLRGKGTRKHLQVTIHRFNATSSLDSLSGRYEIVAYFL